MPTGSSSGGERLFVSRAFVVVAIVALVALAWMARHVLLMAFGAVVIAVALHGLSDPLAKRTPLNNAWSLVVAGVVILALLGAVGWLFGAQFAAQFQDIANRAPEAWREIRGWMSGNPMGRQLAGEIDSVVSGQGGAQWMQALGSVGGWTASLAQALTQSILVLFAAAFLAASPGTYRKGALTLLADDLREPADDAMLKSGAAVKRWLLGSLVSLVVIAVLMTAGLWALGVPAFLALGLIAGIAQFVPVVGPLLAAVPGILIAATVSMETALWAAILYFVVSQLEANLIYPLIQERAVSLPPALILFAIVAMGVLFGPLGVVVATPFTVVLATFIKRMRSDENTSAENDG